MSQLSSEQQELAPLLDRAMVDVLRNGMKVKTGTTDDGNPILESIQPSAAMLNVIRQRVKDLGIVTLPAAGTPAASLIEEARARGLRFDGNPVPQAALPPLSDEDDAASA